MNIAVDFRYAWRMLRKSPGITAVAVLSLALGIGANTAIFSVVNAILLTLLPVKAPQQLYVVARPFPEGPSPSWNYPDYIAMRDRNTVFTELAGYSLGLEAVGVQAGNSTASAAELTHGIFVSGNFFGVLGVTPAIGRTFNAADDRAPGASPYVVLSYAYWQGRFAGDNRIVGRAVRLNGYPFTVIGVAPRGFTGLDVALKPDLFMPIMMKPQVTHVPFERWNNRHWWWMGAVGRLKAATPIAKAEGELFAISKDQEAAERRSVPDPTMANKAAPIVLQPGGRGYSWVANDLRKPLLILFVIVALVLLIACANVANLMLARGAARQREMAVRLAVGASRWRVISQLLAESILIALLGGISGLLLSLLGVRLLMRFAPQPSWAPVTFDVQLDWRVLAFTMAVSLLTGLLFGIIPALRSSRPDLIPALKQDVPGSTGASRFTFRNALVVVQVALSLLLLVGATLFVRTLGNLRALDTGFARENVTIAEVDPTQFGYKAQRTRDFYDRLRARVSALPGVRSASLATITPLSGSSWAQNDSVEGHSFKPGESNDVWFDAVGPRYFETLGTPFVLGRDFRAEDNPAVTPDVPERFEPGKEPPEPPGPRFAIVNETFAKKFFTGRGALGLHVVIDGKYRAEKAYEIVGVVKDARYLDMRDAVKPMMFVPIWRRPPGRSVLLIRTIGSTPQLAALLRREIAALDPVIPLLSVRTLEHDVDQEILNERLIATLSGFFGGLALLLAAVGLYGVISYAVTQRTREIGIRVALGAQRGRLLRMVFGGAAALVITGAVVGVAAALAVTRLVQSFLYEVGAQDPLSIVSAVAILAAAAALAAYLPARRATRVDPMSALRYE